MALPTELQNPRNPGVPRRYGAALAIVPGILGFPIEIQRAPDVAGSPGTWVTIISNFIPTSAGGVFYIDPHPNDGSTWWYRLRHDDLGYTPGDWFTEFSTQPQDVTSYRTGQALPRVGLPALDVRVLAGPTSVTFTYSFTGSLDYSLDGAAHIAVPASPFTVTRNPPGGGDKTVTFRCQLNGMTIIDTTVVPEAAAAPNRSGGPHVIVNGDFESGGPLIDDPDSGWLINPGDGDNTNITYETTSPIDGLRSLKMAVPTSGARRIVNVNQWAVSPGQSAGFGAIGRLSNTNMGATSCRIALVPFDKDGVAISGGAISAFFSTTVDTYKQVLGIMPAGTVTVRIDIIGQNAAVAGDFFIDKVAPLTELSDLPPWAPTLFPTTPLTPPTTPPLLPVNPKLGQHSGEAGINLIKNGDASDGLTNWDSQDGQVYGDGWVTRLGLAFDPIGKGNGGPTVVEVSDAVVGGSVFRFDGITRKMSSEQIIPVNPNLWYELTATLIRRSSTAATSEYIMLTPLDKDGRKIEPWEWRNGGSEKRTQVNGALSGGETTITVDDGSQFGSDGPLTNVYIALNVDSTAGGYSDLPNRETFKLASRSGNVLTIDSGTFPAVADNTWVRRHVSSSSHQYVAASNYNMHAEALDTPVEHSGEIGPHATSVIAPWADPSGGAGAGVFPQGTKYVRVGCLVNNGGAATAQIDLDRFIFRRKNDARDTREVDASSVGRDGADKNLPAGTKVGDGAVFLGVTKGVEVWEAEHIDVVTYVNGPYQVAPVVLVLGGLGWQPESVWGTRAQADSAQAAGSAAANTGVAHWPLKRGEGITATQCTVAALLEEVKTSLLARSVLLSGANLTAVSQSTATDLGTQLPANNDTFRFDYTTRVVAAVNTKLTPNWCEVVMTVDCEIDDGTGFAVYSSQDYEEYAEGLGNTSDSGTVNRSDTFQAAGIVDNDDARMAISAIAITGNPLTGSIVHEVNQGSVNWDEVTAGTNEYARATDPQHKVTVLVIPATNLQTA